LLRFRGQGSVDEMRDGKLDWYLTTIVTTQLRPTASPLVRDALQKIGKSAPLNLAQALELLALRRYLRIQNRQHGDLASLWSWTAAQMNQNINTSPSEDGIMTSGWQLMREAARVQRAFASSNPGYTLNITPPRDLERQVRLWNDNLGVRAAASQILRGAVSEVSKPKYELPALLAIVAAFGRWLQEYEVANEPGNAAPGTSDHGRVRAVDFTVMRGRMVVAGITRATIATEWTAPGWARKLAEAAANTSLAGPLQHPYEPWHWALP
jgi:hypothetical protein